MNKSSKDDDFKNVQTVEQLKKFVNPDESRGRTKYVLRVFYILQFVKQHPDTMEEIGASWCKDNFHFVANSKKLANFLELKSNSINTNFRDHGYKIIPCNTTELRKEFPMIKDTRHWKIRYSNSKAFQSSSVGKDVENIKMIEHNIDSISPIDQNLGQENQSYADQFLSFIPEETYELLKGDQSQIFNLIQMFYAVTEDEKFFKDFLIYITNLWITKINPNDGIAHIHTIIAVILDKNLEIEDDDDDIDETLLLYERNLEYLIPQNYDNSQISEYLSFYSFAKYFIRYGDRFDFSSTLKEITLPVFNYDSGPSFRNWFRASGDKSQAYSLLLKQRSESWLVIPSRAPNKFTLLYRNGQPPFNIQAVHIKHNPIPDDPSKRFSVSFNEGEKYGQTFDEIFTKVLNLEYHDIQTETTYQLLDTPYVTGDDIANRKVSTTANNYNSNENNSFTYPDSQSESQPGYSMFSMNSQYEFTGISQDWGLSQNSQNPFSLDNQSQINDDDDDDDDESKKKGEN